MNWVDLVIIAVFLLYLFEGWGIGFLRGFFDLAGFILSFAGALKFYSVTAYFLIQNFSLPQGIANALGFFISAFFLEIIFSFLFPLVIRKIPKIFFESPPNKFLGFLPSLVSAAVLLAFFLTLILTLPLSPVLKNAVANSKISSFLTSQTAGLERLVNQIFGQAVSETINFVTIKPGEKELIDLRFQVKNLAIDTTSGEQMFALVNNERGKSGLRLLVFDERLAQVARQHGRDMFERGYFSHYTPEGLGPADRLATAGIDFNVTGENLAFTPNLILAHDGLMNSPGHRANILSPDFKKVGIGVVDGGIYGRMFVQEFTD